MEEKDLIKKASSGDEKAFETLISKYQNMIYRLCLLQLKSRENALDVSQEVLLKIWKNLSSFKFDSSFSTWVYAVTKNAVSDFFRRESKHSRVLSLDEKTDDGETGISVKDTTSPAPDDILEQGERKRVLNQAISELSHEHREVIVLRDIEGYSYSEIAEILSENEGTVKSRINRARCKLKEILKTRNFFD